MVTYNITVMYCNQGKRVFALFTMEKGVLAFATAASTNPFGIIENHLFTSTSSFFLDPFMVFHFYISWDLFVH